MYVEYSHEDVLKHNKKDDGWVIYRDYIYDVTHFLDIHVRKKKNFKIVKLFLVAWWNKINFTISW